MSKRTELQSIYDQEGYLTRKLVLDTVRSKPGEYPASHHYIFHVAPEEAAERYYLDRTGELIRSIPVRRRQAESEAEVNIRQWHSIRLESGTAYRDIDEIAEDPFMAKLLLRDLERQWRELWKKAKHIEAFVALVQGDLKAVAG